MPTTRKRKSRRPVYVKSRWRPTEEERHELTRLVDGVDLEAGEDAIAFVQLLDAWEAVKPPWDALPTVPAYHAKGVWLTAGVAVVVSAIRRHVEDGN
jgi:hypothetical protein